MLAYCSKCGIDVEVSWVAPPYSVSHRGQLECERRDGYQCWVEHRHPVTGEVVERVVLDVPA